MLTGVKHMPPAGGNGDGAIDTVVAAVFAATATTAPAIPTVATIVIITAIATVVIIAVVAIAAAPFIRIAGIGRQSDFDAKLQTKSAHVRRDGRMAHRRGKRQNQTKRGEKAFHDHDHTERDLNLS